MSDPRPIGFWLQLVDRLIEDRFATTLEEHGVTRRQWQLLNILSIRDATGAELNSEVAPMRSPADDPADSESVPEHLAELVDSGWVAETASGFGITDPGRVAFERLAAVVTTIRESTTDGITAEQYEQTLATLERMARNLGWSEA